MGQCGASFVRCVRTALVIRELRSSTRYGVRYSSTVSCPTDETTAIAAQDDGPSEKHLRQQEDVPSRARPPHLDQDFFSTGVSSRTQATRSSNWLSSVEPTTDSSTQGSTPAQASPTVATVILEENEMLADETADDKSAVNENEQSNIDELHKFLSLTTDAEAAWNVYEHLRELEAYYGTPIPVVILRRMMVIIGFAKPHRRVYFLRLLNIANLLRQRGEVILVSEWNSLIACAARGQRRKRIEDYQASLHVFRDMMEYSKDFNVQINALDDADSSGHDDGHDVTIETSPHLKPDSPADADSPISSNSSIELSLAQDNSSTSPDIHTYNILLHIAVMTNSDLAVKHASSLLLESGWEPTQRTHSILMAHYSKHNRNGAIRDAMINLLSAGVQIDVSVVNLCLWTYAKQGEMEIAMAIYQSLQANSSLSALETTHETLDNLLDRLIGFHIPRDVQPNSVTYRVLAQAMAYHGDLYGALRVFRDFMESPSNLAPEPDTRTGGTLYAAIMPMYRSLFLGFARHARTPVRTSDGDEMLGARLASLHAKSSPWNLENFFALFETFMTLDPSTEQPSERLVYWIIVAIAKTSGSDMSKMWRVMRRIQTTFNVRWRGRLRRILENTSQGLDTGYVVAFPDDIVKRGGSQRRPGGRSFIS